MSGANVGFGAAAGNILDGNVAAPDRIGTSESLTSYQGQPTIVSDMACQGRGSQGRPRARASRFCCVGIGAVRS